MEATKDGGSKSGVDWDHTRIQKWREWAGGNLRRAATHLLTFCKWLALAAATGLIIGGIGVLFHYSIEWGTALFKAHGWLLWLLPAGGALIALAYRLCHMEKDRGTNLVLTAVRTTERISILTAPLIFLSTCLTHLLGGSAGREGAALQMGASLGEEFGRLLRMDDKDMRIMTMCGMSAAFAALFGTPIAAAIFSMEVISVGVMYYAAIVPCILSSLVGVWLAGICGVPPTRFPLEGIPALNWLDSGRVLLLAALCALVSILFCRSLNLAGRAYARFLPHPILRAAVGGALVIALTYLFGTRDYNGAGMEVIQRAVDGEARPEAFLLKILLTAVTLGAGFKGGEIVPTFFIGATFGNVVGGLLGLSPSFGAGVGIVALFCGVTNCPLTSLLISVELFGSQGLLYLGIAAAVSYRLSGYYGLYSEQKILYSKLRPEFIDKKVT